MLTDPIADLITRLRNGYLARKLYVTAPYSKFKEAILRVLAEHDLVAEVKVSRPKDGHGSLTIYLAYDEKGQSALEHIARVSKPGLRKYWRANQIPRIRGGFGIVILSTPQGVMSGEQAKQKNLGGEPLVEVW